MKAGKKLKNLVSLETRISLYQTAMNNAGRNFNGKKADVRKAATWAADFYKLAVKEIENIGELNIQQIEKTLGKPPIKVILSKKTLTTLMSKAKNGRGRK